MLQMTPFYINLSLASILGLSLLLRIWGIHFGLPYEYHIDEPTYVSAALNLGAGIIGRQTNPTGFSNLLFGEYAAYFIIGRLLGLFPSASAFEQAYRTDPSMFLLLGRLTSVIFGTLTVWTLYQLGKLLYGVSGGLMAAALLAVAFLHMRDSHYAVPDITMVSLAWLAILLAVWAVSKGRLRYLTLAGVFAGLAVATKWSAWPIIFSMLLAVFYTNQRVGLLSRGLLLLLGCAVGFIAGGFQLFLQPSTYFNYALRELQAGEGGGFGIWLVDTVPGWLFYLKTLTYGLGIILLAFALFGSLLYLVRAVRKGREAGVELIILAFPLVYFLVMGATRHYFARYALPLIPFMTLAAAGGILFLSQQLARNRPKFAWSIAAVLLVAAMASSLIASVRHNVLLTRTDTRTEAKEWIESHIPAGTRIAVDWPVHGPPLATSETSISHSPKSYEVVSIGGSGLSEHPVSWYREQGFDFVIVSSFISEIPVVYEDLNQTRRSFYASLDRELSLVQEFQPSDTDTFSAFVFDEIWSLYHAVAA
jgi:hypothetical protein